MEQKLLPQVKNPSRVKIYSWWNTVIRSEAIYVLVYRKHYFASRNQNFQYKGDIFFLESKTENTEQQDFVAAAKYHLGVASNYQVQVFAVHN